MLRAGKARHIGAQLEYNGDGRRQEVAVEAELQLILGRLEAFAAKVQAGLQSADFQTRRDSTRTLVKQVEVDEKQIRVGFRVSPMPLPSSSDDISPHWQQYGRRVLVPHR